MDLAQFWFQAPAGGGGYGIGNSLRYSNTAARLENTSRPAGDGQKGTWSMWVKRGDLSKAIRFFWTGTITTTTNMIGFDIAGNDSLQTNDGGAGKYTSASLYRDYSAWYHIVFVLDTTLATAEDRVKYYVNGVRAPISTTNSIGLNKNTDAGSATQKWTIGTGYNSVGQRSTTRDRYMAEYHYCGGMTLEPTDFGEFNTDGVWVPIEYTGAHGVNGFYLDFSDPNDIGADRSGNGNDFTPTGFELTDTTSHLYDWVADSPTDNYSTVSPLNINVQNVLSDANLTLNLDSSVAYKPSSTIAIPDSGKFYFEGTIQGGNSQTAPDRVHVFGLNESFPPSSTTAKLIGWFSQGTPVIYTGSGSGTGGSGSGFVNGDVLQCAVDATTGKVWMGRNNTWYSTAANADGNPAGGTNESATTVAGTQYHGFSTLGLDSGVTGGYYINFGNRPFAHTPPAGFEPLSTAELPAVAITNPSEHFQTILGPGGPAGTGTPVGVAWKTSVSGDSATFDNQSYGLPATDAGASSTYPMFNWASAVGIGGFDDWYIPAKNEFEIIYRNLKPTTDNNVTNSGANPDAVGGATSNYTATVPAQTTVAAFQAGGAQAFTTGHDTRYWTASQTGSQAFTANFLDGDQTNGAFPPASNKNNSNLARVIRRIPLPTPEPALGEALGGGFYGGKIQPGGTGTIYALIVSDQAEGTYGVGSDILSVAQRTFPNGLWWIKDRANSNQHQLVDSVRGGTGAFRSPAPINEATYVAPAGNSVAWCWNYNAADPSVNGFEILEWTGDPSGPNGNLHVPHRLGAVPEFIMVANRDADSGIRVWHKALGNVLADTGYPNPELRLNESAGAASPVDSFRGFTDTFCNIGPSGGTNQVGQRYIGYVFKSVPGYSSFGQYQGNGSPDGPFVYTNGFRPAFVMTKRFDSAGNWYIQDTSRSAYNLQKATLFSDLTNAEGTDGGIDFLSNGFKVRNTDSSQNTSGGTYLYIAFAEFPFGGSNVSPAPAR